ncbi:MAG: threonine synthase [Fidelibacterota bacterium]
MEHVIGLECLICNREYTVDEIDYICPDHGNEGIVDVLYDYNKILQDIQRNNLKHSRNFTIWRYKPLLPVEADSEVSPLTVGWTPLYRTDRLAKQLGLRNLWLKDDGRLPTASLKDRASAIAVVKSREKGTHVITTASTGNAAAALSGLCASLNQQNVIFVPEDAPEAKIVQLLVYGSKVLLVKGSYDDAFELCLKAAEEFGWYNRNTGYNPYMSEGKKTVVYEICEQLDWSAPDVIFVSVGDGCIIGGLYKGLKDLLALDWIDHMPRIIGVQSSGSNFMYQAWKNSEDVLTKSPIIPHTVADSISTGLPRDRIKALRAVQDSEGAFICVTDDEILSAIPKMAQGSGVFGEPAGAAAFAGLVKAVDSSLVSFDDRVVVLNTGNGLKDVAGAVKAVELVGTKPLFVDPDMEDLKRKLI